MRQVPAQLASNALTSENEHYIHCAIASTSAVLILASIGITPAGVSEWQQVFLPYCSGDIF
ncbi:MAG: hypothetical protein AAF671_04880 [Pseudomonadota bacterium]